jgi:hypothetical protein
MPGVASPAEGERTILAVNPCMTGFLTGFVLVFFAFVALLIVWGRMRRQVGGGFGPTELSDGSMTTTPTGYPEEMHGHGKKISPTDNNAASL